MPPHIESPLDGLPEVGSVLDGKYRIDKVLGVGGMGVVVEATHLELHERVAIKFLQSAGARNEEAVQRFTREARAAAKIKSEHVARVSDVGRLESGVSFLVMEHLVGSDLSELVADTELSSVEAVDFVLQAAEALAEAHKKGIIHRDLKPANLFLTHRADGSPCVKVLDFGISKFVNTGGMTSTNSVMGSPLYMSPEQLASSKNVDARADIWALGVILYELTSGEVPFEGDTLPQLVAAVLNAEPRELGSRAPSLPTDLVAVIMRCLRKEPKERYADLSALADELVPFGSDAARSSAEFISKVVRGRGSLPSFSQQMAVSLAPTDLKIGAETGAPVERDTRSGKRPRRLPLIAAVVAALLVVVLAFALGGDEDTDVEPEPASTVAAEPSASAKPAAVAIASSAASSAPPPAASTAAPSATAAAVEPPKQPPVVRPWKPKPKPFNPYQAR